MPTHPHERLHQAPLQRDASEGLVYLGIEVGELGAWTRLVGGLSSPDRQWRARFTTPPTLGAILERLLSGASHLAGGAAVGAIGMVTWTRGASQIASEEALGWSADELAARLSAALGAPVRQQPAVDAAAIAEARLGAAGEARSLLYAHLGREARSAFVWDGKVYQGAHGVAGQLGHWQVAPDGPRCSCGAKGHLNPFCTSQSIVRLAIGLASQDDATLTAVHTATGGRAEALTAAQVVALAGEGTGPLRELVQHAAGALGSALGAMALTLDPETIVLGGPLGVAGSVFLEWTGERVRETLASTRPASEQPRLLTATFEPRSAAVGGWLLARDGLRA